MSSELYGTDPDSGLPRAGLRPDPASDDQVTAQREAATAARYRALDRVRREQAIARAALAVIERAAETGWTLATATKVHVTGQPDPDMRDYPDILAVATAIDRQAGPPYITRHAPR